MLFHTILVREKVLTQRQRADRHRKPCRHRVVDYNARDAMDSQRAPLTSGVFREPGLAGASFQSAHLQSFVLPALKWETHPHITLHLCTACGTLCSISPLLNVTVLTHNPWNLLPPQTVPSSNSLSLWGKQATKNIPPCKEYSSWLLGGLSHHCRPLQYWACLGFPLTFSSCLPASKASSS